MTIENRINDALSVIRQRYTGESPRVAIILGTGLGELADEIVADASIAYRDIPHFPRSTALAHKGRLVLGRFAGVPVVAMQGRCHLYEGYSTATVSLPVRVMAEFGATTLIVSNASGGINPWFEPADIMVCDSHINFMWSSPPRHLPCDTIRPGRSVCSPYGPDLIELALHTARHANFAAHRGVYVAVTGPSYETRAEYRMFRRIGGDAVGMSTVPEVIAAAECGMQVLALSVITNVAKPDAPQKVDANEVVDVAELAKPKLRAIVEAVVNRAS